MGIRYQPQLVSFPDFRDPSTVPPAVGSDTWSSGIQFGIAMLRSFHCSNVLKSTKAQPIIIDEKYRWRCPGICLKTLENIESIIFVERLVLANPFLMFVQSVLSLLGQAVFFLKDVKSGGFWEMLGGGVSCWSLRLMAGAAMMRLPLAFCSVKAWQKFPGLSMDHGVVFILVGFMFFLGLPLTIDTRHDMHPASCMI